MHRDCDVKPFGDETTPAPAPRFTITAAAPFLDRILYETANEASYTRIHAERLLWAMHSANRHGLLSADSLAAAREDIVSAARLFGETLELLHDTAPASADDRGAQHKLASIANAEFTRAAPVVRQRASKFALSFDTYRLAGLLALGASAAVTTLTFTHVIAPAIAWLSRGGA